MQQSYPQQYPEMGGMIGGFGGMSYPMQFGQQGRCSGGFCDDQGFGLGLAFSDNSRNTNIRENTNIRDSHDTNIRDSHNTTNTRVDTNIDQNCVGSDNCNRQVAQVTPPTCTGSNCNPPCTNCVPPVPPCYNCQPPTPPCYGTNCYPNTGSVTLVSGTSYTPPTTYPAPGVLSSGVLLSNLPYTGVSDTTKVALLILGLSLWSGFVAWMLMRKKQAKKQGSMKETIAQFKQANLVRKQALA